MIRTTRTVVVASLALAALTGCGGAAAEARGAHTYEPLPPLSTATPSPTPEPQPTSRPAPDSEAPPSGSGGVSGGAAAGNSGGTPAAAAVAAPAPAPVAVPVQVPVQPPRQGPAAPAAGEFSGQMTERTTTSTTTTTSTRLEAGLMIELSCEGLCVLEDLMNPELTGPDGPFSEKALTRALEEDLGRAGADTVLTEDLAEQLLRSGWTLADRDVAGGGETLVLAPARAK